MIGRGAVDAFLRGTDSGVVFGSYACQWLSPQCPLAPEAPPPLKSLRERAAALVDPALMPALDLYRALYDTTDLDGDTYTFALIAELGMTVTFESLPLESVARFYYGAGLPPRMFNTAYRGETLVHWFRHWRTSCFTLSPMPPDTPGRPMRRASLTKYRPLQPPRGLGRRCGRGRALSSRTLNGTTKWATSSGSLARSRPT